MGDTWYLFHTNAGGRNVPVLTSPDLVTGRRPGTPCRGCRPGPTPARPGRRRRSQLAPDRFLLYYTVAGREPAGSASARAVASAPQAAVPRRRRTGPLICQAELGGAIDASPFRDTDGSLWLLWKNDGNAIGVDTWLWSQRLADDGLTLIGEPTKLLKQTEPWEGTLIEGPFFHRHDGRLYLFFAANAYDGPTYAEGYAVCETPTGPCVKAPENPILKTNGAASGPGHASMVVRRTAAPGCSTTPGRPARRARPTRAGSSGSTSSSGPTASRSSRARPEAPAEALTPGRDVESNSSALKTPSTRHPSRSGAALTRTKGVCPNRDRTAARAPTPPTV